jgi:hypothetical protein
MGVATHERMICTRGVQISENQGRSKLKNPVAEFLMGASFYTAIVGVSQKQFILHQGLDSRRFGSMPDSLLHVIANVCVTRVWAEWNFIPHGATAHVRKALPKEVPSRPSFGRQRRATSRSFTKYR